MSFSFKWFAKPVRVVRRTPGRRVREWRAHMVDEGVHGLVEAGTDIQVGDEIQEVSLFGMGRLEAGRTVAHLDWASRSPMQQGVITWVGAAPGRRPSEEEKVDFDIEVEAIRLLDWLANKPLGNKFFPVEGYLDDNQLPSHSQWLLRDYLNDRGLVKDASGMGSVDLMISSEGLAFVRDVRAERSNPAARTRTLRKQMLLWLYERDPNDPPHDWSGFQADRRFTMLGEQFSEGEVAAAAEYLHSRGLISGISIEEVGPGSLYPQLTPDGRDCVTDHEGNVSDYLNHQQGGGTTNVYMTGVQGNTVIASSNVVQNVASGLDMRSLLDFAGFVRQVASTLGLSDKQREDLETTAEELHNAARSPVPERGKLRRLISALMEGLAKAAPTVVSSTAITMGEEALKAITG